MAAGNLEGVRAQLARACLAAAPPRLCRHAILAAMLVAVQPQAALAQATSGVREAEVRFESALTSGDVAAATTFFIKDGTLVAGACETLEGRPAVRSFLDRLALSGSRLTFAPEDIVQTGDVDAREVGTFQLTDAERGSRPGDGRYATTWVRRGGVWKVSMTAWETPGHADGGSVRTPSAGCITFVEPR